MNALQAFQDMDSFSIGISITGALTAILSVIGNLQVPGLFSTGDLVVAGLVVMNLGFTLAVFVQSKEVEWLDQGGGK